jgi:hypothetical protein
MRRRRLVAVPRRGPALAVGVLFVASTLVWAWPATAQDRASRRPPRPQVTLPEGPVRQIILRSCSACHGIDEYGYYAMTRQSWRDLIERMKVTPSGLVPGAEISDQDTEILLDWLVENFGPDATPFRRQYVVREVTDENRLSDEEAMAQLEAACGGCHSPLVPTLAADLDEDGWRETLTGKIATGTRLLVDEVDPLVEWLTR